MEKTKMVIKLKDSHIAILEVIVLLLSVTLLLPPLISAKSTVLVITGISIILGLLIVASGLTKYQPRIYKLIGEDKL